MSSTKPDYNSLEVFVLSKKSGSPLSCDFKDYFLCDVRLQADEQPPGADRY